jgi:hypothetical protein
MRPAFVFFALLLASACGLVSFQSAADAQILRKKQPAPVVAAAQPAQGVFDGSLRKKILLAVVRHKTINHMVSEGVKGKKYTKAEAEAAYDKLGDDVIAGAVAEASPAAQGQLVGGKLTDFLQWLADHQDQIMAIVKMIISIIALFG